MDGEVRAGHDHQHRDLDVSCNELRDFVVFFIQRDGLASTPPAAHALVHEWFSPRSVGGAEKVVQQVDSYCALGCEPQMRP